MPEWGFRALRLDEGRVGGAQNFAIAGKTHNFVRESIQNIRDQALISQDPVEARFDFVDLTGPELTEFLVEIGWDKGLRAHLEGCANGRNHDGRRIRSNLDKVDQGLMRVLFVSDSRTRGLTGGEFDESGNFCKLCRNEMIPTEGAESASRGGSFGIGKSVFWAFSGLQTVVFSSTYRDDENFNTLTSRVFGRTYLPSHFASEEGARIEFGGEGFFCQIDRTTTERLRRSMTFEQANLGPQSLLRRDLTSTGSTVAVLMFEDPNEEEQPPLETLASRLTDAIEVNFWPLLHDKLLDARVSWRLSGHEIRESRVSISEALQPFVRAYTWPHDSDVFRESENPSPLEVGEVAYFASTLAIPVRRPDENQPDGCPSVNGSIPICVTRITEIEYERLIAFEARTPDLPLVNRIALMRGPRMVVETFEPAPTGLNEFVGVVRAGLSRPTNTGDPNEDDRLVELFLRDSEPPAHDSWIYKAKVKEAYKRGSIQAVPLLLGDIRKKIPKLLRTTLRGESARPDGLADLLRIRRTEGSGETGGSGSPISFRGVCTSAIFDLEAKEVRYGILVRKLGGRRASPPQDWKVFVSLRALGEANDERLPISVTDISDELVVTPIKSAGDTIEYSVHVSSGLDRFEIELVGSLSEFSDLLVSRARVDHFITGESMS